MTHYGRFPAQALARDGKRYQRPVALPATPTGSAVVVIDLLDLAPTLNSPISPVERMQAWVNDKLSAASFPAVSPELEAWSPIPQFVPSVSVDHADTRYQLIRKSGTAS